LKSFSFIENKMSEKSKIKVEPSCDDYDQIETIANVVSNIKEEPAVEFVLILPPRQVKIEPTTENDQTQTKNVKKFQCQQCPKSFEKQKSLYHHEKTHKPKVKCHFCSKIISKLSLKAHLKIHENIRKFHCDHCAAGFVIKGHLVQHMWNHRSEKKFNCTQCNRTFNKSGNFKTHIRSHSKNPRPFQCNLCPNNYARPDHLKYHSKTVHTNQSFKCDDCDFTTRTKENLARHKKVHSNLKPFSCQICEKKFKTNGEVQRHQAVHRKMKDFKCKTCGKMFGTQRNLREHERGVHGKKFKRF
jgi:KRAB domain-containing zinc finger protein